MASVRFLHVLVAPAETHAREPIPLSRPAPRLPAAGRALTLELSLLPRSSGQRRFATSMACASERKRGRRIGGVAPDDRNRGDRHERIHAGPTPTRPTERPEARRAGHGHRGWRPEEGARVQRRAIKAGRVARYPGRRESGADFAVAGASGSPRPRTSPRLPLQPAKRECCSCLIAEARSDSFQACGSASLLPARSPPPNAPGPGRPLGSNGCLRRLASAPAWRGASKPAGQCDFFADPQIGHRRTR